MEESLKALRLTYRTLLVLLVAILLFALSPNRYVTYTEAYAFLDKLQSIDSNNYTSWAQGVSNKFVDSRHDFLSALFQEVADRGGPTVEWNHIDNQTIDRLLTMEQTGPSIRNGSLESINRDFRDDIPVRRLFLPVGRLSSIILNDLDSNHTYRLDDLTISGTVAIGRANVQLYLYDDLGELRHVYGTTTFDNRPIEGQSFRVWLTDNRFAGLISEQDASGIVFEPLRPLWPFIYFKSISDAKDWIQQELLKLGDVQVLSVFGISITEFQAVITAPGITFILLLALGAQLRHIRRLDPTSDDNLLSTFPWIPMFSGPIGRIARGVTLLGLPIIANALLLVRAQEMAVWAGWLEWILLIGASGFAFVETSHLATHRQTSANHFDKT